MIRRDSCYGCGVKLSNENWYPSSRKYQQYICKSCNRKRMHDYNIKNSEKRRVYARKYYTNNKNKINAYKTRYRQNHPNINRKSIRKTKDKVRDMVFSHYCKNQVQCIRCGYSDIRALSIDHINGNGAKEREKLKINGGYMFYKWLRDNDFPEGYQVLCMNCQFIKRSENEEY